MKNRTFAAFALLTMAAAGRLSAQEDIRLEQRLEEERRQLLEKVAQEDQGLFLDYGGWIRSEYIQFDDRPNKSERHLRFYDLRLWASARIDENHRFYVRTLTQLSDYNANDQFRAKENDWRGPNLDQGFYEMDIRETLDLDVKSLVGRAGRQFFQVGRGITLNSVMDGVHVEGQYDFWGFKLLGAITVPSTDDIDRSRPRPDESHRLFYGAEVTYLQFPRYKVYGFALVERDLNRDATNVPAVDFAYNAEYWGLGLRSDPLPRVNVQGGFTLETGSSGAIGPEPAGDTEKIWAQSANLLVQAFPKLPMQPRVSAEYLWGSGDPDRLSVTNTVGGNASDTVDRGFLPFGFVNTGIALFPRLSNLHIFRLGGAFRPLESVSWFDKLELGADIFVYRKDHQSGAISDLRANVADRDIGEEIDLSLTWRATSDLIASIRYGRFMPGEAYNDNAAIGAKTDQNRDFLSASMTYSF